MPRGTEIITVSRRNCTNNCPYQANLMYEHGVRPTEDRECLRFGGIMHEAIDIYVKRHDEQPAFDLIYNNYAACPTYIDEHSWRVEEQEVLQLFAGYIWRWGDDPTEIIESETVFNLPILNPETGRATPLFRLGGKRDKKIRQPNGRIGIREHKTHKGDIGPDSEYYQILAIDLQLSTYFSTLPDVEFIEYDVIRRASIRPKQVPILDDDGVKIVLDADGARVRTADGKKWRESADTAKGYVLQTRIETPEEFGERLSQDINERPDFYYQRREIPRLSADMEQFASELWQFQQSLRWRQQNGCWPRNPSIFKCKGCDVKALCFSDYKPGDPLPNGFEQIEFVHPELDEKEMMRHV